MSYHVLHGVTFPSASFLSQVTDTTLDNGGEVQEIFPSGHPYPLHTVLLQQKPAITGRTTQIKTAVQGFGAGGVDLSGGNTDLWYKRMKDASTRESAAATQHSRFRMTKGLGLLNELGCRQGGIAEAGFAIYPTWDGTNDILQLLADGAFVALSGTPTATEEFTLGPVKVTGSFGTVTISQLNGWSISHDFQVENEPTDGLTWPQIATIKQLSSRVRIDSRQLQQWSKFGLRGQAISSLICYLRRRDRTDNYAVGTSQHIAIVASGGLIRLSQTAGAGNDPTVTTLEVVPNTGTADANMWSYVVDTTIS